MGGVSGTPSGAQEGFVFPAHGCGGGRHPDRREAIALRGAVVEPRSRSVRSCSRVSPSGRTHRRQRMSLGRRGGERRRRAPFKPRSPPQRRASRAHSAGDTSFARSKDTCFVFVARLFGASRGVSHAVASVSRSGKPARAGGTGTEAVRLDGARLAARHGSREGAPGRVRTGRRSRPPSQRGTRVTVEAPARRYVSCSTS